MSLARYAKTLGVRYSHARFISSTPYRLGWVDKIKGVFTGKPSSPSPDSSSSSFSLNDFADQMDKAKTFGMLKKFEVGRCSEATISESFRKQSSILRYLGSIDPGGENLKTSHKQDAATHCNCTISEVENTLSKYTWAKEAQKKMDKLKEEGKPVPKTFTEVQKMMGSTPLDVARSNLKSSGKLGRNAPCPCGSGKRCCAPA
ncbi:uncharacterized protein LOC109840198 isoform X2 [Asparagus officinalis]|uniref:uncharacterized protein LOC109840198 isoform X2 n=1 Tax=Asparagus officinalis TaxID=4686 RepID=UPI00098DF2D4|nr:uncharacterized protein LOC109840198 isoform X2 [Asparagus officinalis]